MSEQNEPVAASQIGVFAKFWEPGKVKTRLARTIGNTQAAEIYKQFIRNTLERTSGIATRHTLVVTPERRLPDFLDITPDGWSLETQSEGDLGERISAYFNLAFEHQFKKVLLVGSDSPTIPSEIIKKAFEELDHFDCVIGPSHDGGYYLIGLTNFQPEIFESIQWSSELVFQQTMERAAALKLSVSTLATWYDVDTIEDLKRVLADLSSLPPERLTRTETEICSLATSILSELDLPQES